jgi:hypothetical protein
MGSSPAPRLGDALLGRVTRLWIGTQNGGIRDANAPCPHNEEPKKDCENDQ